MVKRHLVLFCVGIIFVFSDCKNEMNNEKTQLRGNVFGTTYQITYLYDSHNYQTSIDSVFLAVNTSLSTYIPSSDISKINRGDANVVVDELFLEVFNKSKRIYKETNGYFDPTVGNLVNAWGFGPEDSINSLDSSEVTSLMQFVGLDNVIIDSRKVIKQYSSTYIDFNSIAKGFGIDLIARLLEDKGIQNYLIEIGGEIRGKGNSLRHKPWRIGIESPNTDGTRSFVEFVDLENQSIASSGNYRKFRIDENGKKYVHTINPKTGFATESNLLAATVIATLDCADVDAYATAIMAMGFEKAEEFLSNNKQLQVILIYNDQQGNLQEYTNYTPK
jgi:thiamine biosynthesis lipoprotein